MSKPNYTLSQDGVMRLSLRVEFRVPKKTVEWLVANSSWGTARVLDWLRSELWTDGSAFLLDRVVAVSRFDGACLSFPVGDPQYADAIYPEGAFANHEFEDEEEEA